MVCVNASLALSLRGDSNEGCIGWTLTSVIMVTKAKVCCSILATTLTHTSGLHVSLDPLDEPELKAESSEIRRPEADESGMFVEGSKSEGGGLKMPARVGEEPREEDEVIGRKDRGAGAVFTLLEDGQVGEGRVRLSLVDMTGSYICV